MKLESLVIADQNAAVNTFPTPWELEMPEACDRTEREEQSKAGLITGVKS